MLKVALYLLGGVIFYFVKSHDYYAINAAEEALEEEKNSIANGRIFKITVAFMSLLWPLWIIPNLIDVIFLRGKYY